MAINRGLRTLPLRLERSTNYAFKVVEFLKNHPQVEEVIFPFDSSFKQYELAKAQMKNGGGLLTFIIKAESI